METGLRAVLHGLAYWAGVTSPDSGPYLAWSGILSDIAKLTLLAGLYHVWRKHHALHKRTWGERMGPPLTPRPMHAGAIGWHRRLWARLTGTGAVSGILGPDVSEFQPGINWQAVGANRLFAFTRATFGTSIIDPTFSSYQPAMRQFVRYRAFYHFLVANVSAAAQASLFCKVVGQLRPGENVMLDWEDYGPTGGLPSAAMASTFCQLVERALGLPANSMLVYSSGSTPAIGRPRIIASYGSAPSVAWVFWQYTDGQINAVAGEPVPGIGACDQNVFAGTETQLASYFLGGVPAPPDPPPPPLPEDEMGRTRLAYDPATQQKHQVNLADLGNNQAALWYWGYDTKTEKWIGPTNIVPSGLVLSAGVDCEVMGSELHVTATPVNQSQTSSLHWSVPLPLPPAPAKIVFGASNPP